MKPLEPGCLALITRGDFANRVCTLIERAAPETPQTVHLDKDPAKELSLVFGQARWMVEFASDTEAYWWIAERNLMRIDGGDAELTDQKQELEMPA